MKSSKSSRGKDAKELATKWRKFKCGAILVVRTRLSDQPLEGSCICCNKCDSTETIRIHGSSEYVTLLDFFHFLILVKKYKLLYHFLVELTDENIASNTLQLKIEKEEPGLSLDIYKDRTPTREDSWVIGANYLHFAAKYCPEALEVLLKDSKNRFQELIEKPSRERKIRPLHLAAMNQTNLSAK